MVLFSDSSPLYEVNGTLLRGRLGGGAFPPTPPTTPMPLPNHCFLLPRHCFPLLKHFLPSVKSSLPSVEHFLPSVNCCVSTLDSFLPFAKDSMVPVNSFLPFVNDSMVPVNDSMTTKNYPVTAHMFCFSTLNNFFSAPKSLLPAAQTPLTPMTRRNP